MLRPRFRYSEQVTLVDDGAGKGRGSIRIAPSGRNWQVEYLTVKCSSHVLESIASVYENYIGPDYLVDSTLTGSVGDTTDTVIVVRDGYALIVEWVGGDVGAVATVTWTGEEID